MGIPPPGTFGATHRFEELQYVVPKKAKKATSIIMKSGWTGPGAANTSEPSPKGLCLQLHSVDDLRALTIPTEDEPWPVDVTFDIESYERPTGAWVGRSGSLPGLTCELIRWPDEPRGPVHARLQTGFPVPLSGFARVVAQRLLPSSAVHALGSPTSVIQEGAPFRVLAMLPTPWAPQVLDLVSKSGLTSSDLTARSDGLRRTLSLQARSNQPPAPDVTVLGVPLLDLYVHNPTGRQIDRVTDSATLALAHNELRIVGESGALSAVRIPLRLPIRRELVGAIREVGPVSLTRVARPESQEDADHIAFRLVELCATGLPLFGGQEVLGYLGPLRNLIPPGVAALSAPDSPLASALVSATLVREAMLRNSGRRHLDEASQRFGYATLRPSVTALVVSKRPNRIADVCQSMADQTYRPLEVTLVLHGFELTPAQAVQVGGLGIPIMTLSASADVTLGEALSLGTQHSSGDLVAKIDDDDLYDRYHIEDLVLAHQWSGAQVVGKQPEYVFLQRRDVTIRRQFKHHSYVRQVAGGTILIAAADLWSVGGWRPLPRAVDRSLLESVHQAGGLVYATHGTGYMHVRHGQGHTWTVDDEELIDSAKEVWQGLHQSVIGGCPFPLCSRCAVSDSPAAPARPFGSGQGQVP